jgi:hypothetical protein
MAASALRLGMPEDAVTTLSVAYTAALLTVISN